MSSIFGLITRQKTVKQKHSTEKFENEDKFSFHDHQVCVSLCWPRLVLQQENETNEVPPFYFTYRWSNSEFTNPSKTNEQTNKKKHAGFTG